jgi:hypothetical protein
MIRLISPNPVTGNPVIGTPGDRDWMGLSWGGMKPLDGETMGAV